MKNPEAYDQAVALVRDLREIAVRQQSLDAFAARLAALRAAHARKVNLLTKLRRAGVLKE